MKKIPQLRIAVTFPCGKACVYCRPGGEAIPVLPKREMTKDEIVLLTSFLVAHGITDIKLTGGDPLLRADIVDIVRDLKSLSGVKSIHLVTRHARAAEHIYDFASAGLDCLNFSLDSLDPDTWSRITRVKGHQELMHAVEIAAKSNLNLKINTVVIKGVNDREIFDLIEFTGRLKATIKFLDLIVDIPGFPVVSNNYGKNYFELDSLVPVLSRTAVSVEMTTQPGGLGHPMHRFLMPNGATVILKSSKSGAWYGDVCTNCAMFPCHDAIMALRLTSDGKLQRCLLRQNNLIDLLGMVTAGCASSEIDAVVESVLDTYRNAKFYDHDDILREQRERAVSESIISLWGVQ